MVGNPAHNQVSEPNLSPNINSQEQTLEAFLRLWARHSPDAMAITDADNRNKTIAGSPLQLSFQVMNNIVDRLALQFNDHGLKAGDVIALQLPNTTELPVLLLASHRAGLIPCLFPLHWRNQELSTALQMIPAKAMITVGELKGHSHSQMMCDLAYDHMSVRYIYGIGENQVDGITSLNSFFSEASQSSALEGPLNSGSESVSQKLDHPALITWSAHPTLGLRPIYRTSRELIANGLIHVQEAGLSNTDIVLNPYPLTGLTGLASTFIPSLLVGAHLIQHAPFNYDAFISQLMSEKVTYTAVPAPILKALVENKILLNSSSKINQIGCVWATPLKRQKRTLLNKSSPIPVFDILNLNDTSVYISRRNGLNEQGQIKLGEKKATGLDGEEVRLLETRFKGRLSSSDGNKKYMGALYVRGMSVPIGAGTPVKVKSDTNISQGWVNTGVQCSIAQNAKRMDRVLEEPEEDLIYHGGITLRTKELNRLYSNFVGFEEAAVLTIPDPVMGERLCVVARVVEILKPTLKDLTEYLIETGVSPCKIPERLFCLDYIPKNSEGMLDQQKTRNIVREKYKKAS